MQVSGRAESGKEFQSQVSGLKTGMGEGAAINGEWVVRGEEWENRMHWFNSCTLMDADEVKKRTRGCN